MRKGVTKMYTPFPRKKTYGLAQSFAWADAMLCVDTCKALRWHLQSFALAHAMLCVGTCNALRLRWAKKGIEIVCPILDKRKGRKDSPHGAL